MDNRGTLTMSRKELNRLEILGRVLERRLTQAKAAEQLGLGIGSSSPVFSTTDTRRSDN